ARQQFLTTFSLSDSVWPILTMNAFVRITLLFRLAIRARQAKRLPMATGILGLTGRAETAIAPEGTISVRNLLWRARSRVDISPGESVTVTGMNGITLDVDPEHDQDTNHEGDS